MYLQLAENEKNTDFMYQPLETNQGTIYVRPDLLSAAGIVKPKPNILKSPAVKSAAGKIVGKAITGAAGAATGGAAPIVSTIFTGIKKGAQFIKKKKDEKKAAEAEAATAADSAGTGIRSREQLGKPQPATSSIKTCPKRACCCCCCCCCCCWRSWWWWPPCAIAAPPPLLAVLLVLVLSVL